jgi:hypothetical protein
MKRRPRSRSHCIPIRSVHQDSQHTLVEVRSFDLGDAGLSALLGSTLNVFEDQPLRSWFACAGPRRSSAVWGLSANASGPGEINRVSDDHHDDIGRSGYEEHYGDHMTPPLENPQL